METYVGTLLCLFICYHSVSAQDFDYNEDYNRGTVANGKFYSADKTRDWKLTSEDGDSWPKYKNLDQNSDGVVTFDEFKPGIDLPLPDLGGKVMRNVVYKEADGRVLLMDIYQPAKATEKPTPVLYYSHGGGWSGGQKEASGDILTVCQKLSNRGFTVVMVSYRLVREWDKNDTVTMKDCIVDCRDGLRFLKKHDSKLGIDMNRVAVFGSSAGGHLAQLMTFSKSDSFLGKEELRAFAVSPATGVSWFGPSDFRDGKLFEWDGPGQKFAVDFWAKKITRGESFNYPQESAEVQTTTDKLSPVWWLSSDSAPLLHVHGDIDSVIPPQHATHLQQAAKKTGAPVTVQIVKGAGHGWWAQDIVPDRNSVIEQTVEFIVANTKR